MQDQQKGQIVFLCDGGCGEILSTKTLDFDLAQALRREAGWIAAKEKDEWKHYCPNCK